MILLQANINRCLGHLANGTTEVIRLQQISSLCQFISKTKNTKGAYHILSYNSRYVEVFKELKIKINSTKSCEFQGLSLISITLWCEAWFTRTCKSHDTTFCQEFFF